MSQSTVNSDATNQTDAPVEEGDLLVVGGGKAGKSLAMLRAKAGDKVVMVAGMTYNEGGSIAVRVTTIH